jgi:RNA polymerase sigma-70 factor (ECF subfamily)
MFGGASSQGSLIDSETRWVRFESEAMPHVASLFRIAMWLTGDRMDAEDLVQETLTEALGSFHRFASGTNCRSWLISIMYHRQSKTRRATTRLQVINDREEFIAETVAFQPPTPQNVSDEEVLQALKRLPRAFQEAVVLADIEEFSYKEIAAVLGVPVGTVMSRISRGRKLLRIELAAYAQAHGFGRTG